MGTVVPAITLITLVIMVIENLHSWRIVEERCSLLGALFIFFEAVGLGSDLFQPFPKHLLSSWNL